MAKHSENPEAQPSHPKKVQKASPKGDATGSAAITLSTIKWTGWLVFGIGLLGTIACLATIPFLGYAPENAWAEGALNFVVPGLFIPFALMLLHGNLSSVWIAKDGGWDTTLTGKQAFIRFAISLPFFAIALSLIVVGALPLLQFVPDNAGAAGVIGVLVIGPILFAVVVAAVAGATIMMGWRAGIFGLVFGFGFIALVFGRVNENSLWTVLGVAGLALAIVGFYFIGAKSGWLPDSFRAGYGTWIAVAAGIILFAWGAIVGDLWMMGGGAFTVAAWAGIRLAVRRKARSTSPQ